MCKPHILSRVYKVELGLKFFNKILYIHDYVKNLNVKLNFISNKNKKVK